jgi:hypothetical protein
VSAVGVASVVSLCWEETPSMSRLRIGKLFLNAFDANGGVFGRSK